MNMNISIGDELSLNGGDGRTHFEVIDFLSEGGSGSCYLCKSKINGEYFVLKVYKNGASNDENHIERTLHKAEKDEKYAKILYNSEQGGSPYFFSTSILKDDDGISYLIMGTIAGCSLAKYIEDNYANKKFDEKFDDIYIIIKNVISAVSQIHTKCLHLDLKPDNLFLVKNNTKNIIPIDFGSAVERREHDMPKKAEQIIYEYKHSGSYASTSGFRTERLATLVNLIESIDTMQESEDKFKERCELIEQLEQTISVKEDVYSVIACFFCMVFGDSRLFSSDGIIFARDPQKELIKRMKQIGVPKYMHSCFVELFAELLQEGNEKNAYSEVKYNSLLGDENDKNTLIYEIDRIYRIYKKMGFEDEIVIYKAEQYFEKYLKEQLKDFDPDLLCEIKIIEEEK